MGLLLGLAALLGVFLIVQIIRVFELTSKLKEDDQSTVSWKDNRLRGYSWAIYGIGFFAFFLWIIQKWGPMMLPEAASEHGATVDFLFDLNWAILIIAFTITHILLFVFAFKYFAKPGTKAQFITHNNKLEMIWTVVPAAALAVIIIYGLSTWNDYTADASEDAINIELYAKQFDWTARYSGADNQLGKANFNFINMNNPLGLINNITIEDRISELNQEIADIQAELKHVPKDGLKEEEMLKSIHHKETQLAKIHAYKRNNELSKNAANDDKLVKVEFHIPVGKEVNFKMRSRDVIHSAFMPHFRAQMNCVPGMVTGMRFTPTITTAEMRKKTGNPEFDYILLCAKICGAAHYNMQMNIIVDTEEDYNKWLAEQKTFNETITAALGITELDNQLAQN